MMHFITAILILENEDSGKEKEAGVRIVVVLHPWEGSLLLSPECLLQSYKRAKHKYPKEYR